MQDMPVFSFSFLPVNAMYSLAKVTKYRRSGNVANTKGFLFLEISELC